MISQTHSRWENFYNLDAIQSVPFVTNGQVVQAQMEGGTRKARPSDATADSIFLGVSFGVYKGLGLTIPRIETVTTGAAAGGFATALLTKQVTNPADLTVYVGNGYAGTLMTGATADPTTATAFRLEADGRTVTVAAANAAKELFVVYKYSPTAIETRFLLEGGGEVYPGNNAPAIFGQIGVITAGIVFTDQFDPAVNWNATNDATVIRGGANGKFTTSGTGCVCHGVRVHTVPNMDTPFLGLTLSHSI